MVICVCMLPNCEKWKDKSDVPPSCQLRVPSIGRKKKRSWPLAGPPLLFMTHNWAACLCYFCHHPQSEMSKWWASVLGKLEIKVFPLLFFSLSLPSLLICLSHAAATWLETSLLGKIALVKGWDVILVIRGTPQKMVCLAWHISILRPFFF